MNAAPGRQDDEPERNETPAEKLDRNWAELLQELRVAQTGIQILFAFLLILPFQARFAELGTASRTLYLIIVALVTISTVCILAPVVTHRFLFGRHKKDVLMAVSDQLAKSGLAALGLALIGAVAFVVELLAGAFGGAVAAVGVGALVTALWLLLPSMLLRRSKGSEPRRY